MNNKNFNIFLIIFIFAQILSYFYLKKDNQYYFEISVVDSNFHNYLKSYDSNRFENSVTKNNQYISKININKKIQGLNACFLVFDPRLSINGVNIEIQQSVFGHKKILQNWVDRNEFNIKRLSNDSILLTFNELDQKELYKIKRFIIFFKNNINNNSKRLIESITCYGDIRNTYHKSDDREYQIYLSFIFFIIFILIYLNDNLISFNIKNTFKYFKKGFFVKKNNKLIFTTLLFQLLLLLLLFYKRDYFTHEMYISFFQLIIFILLNTVIFLFKNLSFYLLISYITSLTISFKFLFIIILISTLFNIDFFLKFCAPILYIIVLFLVLFNYYEQFKK